MKIIHKGNKAVYKKLDGFSFDDIRYQFLVDKYSVIVDDVDEWETMLNEFNDEEDVEGFLYYDFSGIECLNVLADLSYTKIEELLSGYYPTLTLFTGEDKHEYLLIQTGI